VREGATELAGFAPGVAGDVVAALLEEADEFVASGSASDTASTELSEMIPTHTVDSPRSVAVKTKVCLRMLCSFMPRVQGEPCSLHRAGVVSPRRSSEGAPAAARRREPDRAAPLFAQGNKRRAGGRSLDVEIDVGRLAAPVD
jgi:hypothetical protein